MDAVDEQMNKQAADTVAKLDEIRMLARDAAKHAALAGLPTELHWEIIKLMSTVEFLEARASEYASKVAA